MSSVEDVKEFMMERLSAAAEEIFSVFKTTIVQYEQEIDRQRKLLDIVWKPEVKLHRIEIPQQHVCKEEEEVHTEQQLSNKDCDSSVTQKEPEPPQIKEEQNGPFISLEDLESSNSQLSSSEEYQNPEMREEHIPKTSEDDSESSGTNESLQPEDQKKIMHGCLKISMTDETRERRVSPAELNEGSSMQVPNRGRSPSGKECSSSIRPKRRRLNTASPPSTRTSSNSSSKQSDEEETGDLLEKSASDLEHNPPDSSSFPTDDVDDGSLSIPVFSKKKDGSRMYYKNLKPEVKLHRLEIPQQHVCKEEEEEEEKEIHTEQQLSSKEDCNSSVTQKEPEPPQIKVEQNGPFISLEGLESSNSQLSSSEEYQNPEMREEHIPKTSEDDSESSGTNESLQPEDQKKIMHGCLKISMTDETRERRVSPAELNEGSSMQVPNRGRSPSGKECSSSIRPKRRRLNTASPPSTRTSSNSSSKQSDEEETGDLLEKSASDLEHNPPDSSSFPTDDVDDGSLSIPVFSKKKDGSRMYYKKQFCLYCKIGVVKMARHLERAHGNKPEVAQALSFPKGSKERKMHLEHLRNRGNFAHNVDVLNAGSGILVPRKQPPQDSQAQDFLHCEYCHGYFSKKVLRRHMNTCRFKPKTPGASAVPPPPGVKEEFWKLLSNMVQDEVSSAVKSDVCIMEYGGHLYNRLGHDVGKHEYIRQKLRELGRLLICSRTTTPLKTIEDHIKPANFMHVEQAVKHIAGYDSKTNTYKFPSLAVKIGHSLTKITHLVESRANVEKDDSTADDTCAFDRVYETKWNELLSAISLRTPKEFERNVPLLLPFTKDVQTLHSYLDVQQQKLCSSLSTDTSPQTWAELAKVTLTQVILFNRQRAGEVSKMPLSAYLSQNPSDSQEGVNEALTDLEKTLCQHFKRIEIRGKKGGKVPVLLTPLVQQALDVLVSKRQECGIPQGNAYVFARPSAFTCYRGSDCLRHFAKACGAECPDNLTSTKLRKQTGTLSQVLSLSNTELDQLADFLGHDVRTHQQFYRQPEGTLQLAKISKVLMDLGQGRLAEFKGRSLDDIILDPEENVHMDSDTEEVDEPESQGRQLSKRKMWEKDEIMAVEKHMMSFITACRIPRKRDCDKCLRREKVALKDRNWLAIKFYVRNRITALKNNVH